MTDLMPMRMLDVEPKFVLEVASGVREPSEIAEDFGYSARQWEQLKEYPPFVRLVDDKKAELKASGYTFKMKSAFIAEELLEKLFEKAKEDDSSFHTVLQLATFTAKAAGLDQPPKTEAQMGSNFSISINLGGETVQIGVKTDKNEVEKVKNEGSGVIYEHEMEEEEYDFALAFMPYEPVPFEKSA